MMTGNPTKKGSGAKLPPSRGAANASSAGSSGIQYPLPKDTAEIYRAAHDKSIFNPALIFDRFVPDLSSDNKKKEEWKKQALKDALIAPDKSALKAYLARWKALAEVAGAKPFQLKTDWRFIPGLGRKSALEIGFSFHRYGFPYLPGSAVKGIARTWALFELVESLGLSTEQPDAFSELDKVLEKPQEVFLKEIKGKWSALRTNLQKAEDFRAVFGTLETAGGAIFFEALPNEAFALEVDIMNPHYGPYYQQKGAPVDWYDPKPVPFLTVPSGKVFHFAVGWRAGAARTNELRLKAETWLKKGLEELGAGAKTAAGYGYFK